MSVHREKGAAVEGKMLYIAYEDLVYNVNLGMPWSEMIVKGRDYSAVAVVMEEFEWKHTSMHRN